MDIDKFRAIDYYVGIPLCLVMRIFDILFGWIFIRKRSKIRKILLIELSEMGSMIIGYSMIEKLQELYPRSKLYFMTFHSNRESIDLLKIIPEQNVLTIRTDSIINLVIDTFEIIYQMWKLGIDVTIDMELFSRYTALLTYLSRSWIRIGFYKFHLEGLYRGNLLTHNVAYNQYMHIGHNFQSLIRAISVSVDSRDPKHQMPILKEDLTKIELKTKRILSTESQKKTILDRLRQHCPEISTRHRLIVINHGASKLLPIRQWPLPKYCKLVDKLLKDKRNMVVIVGMPYDKKTAERIRDYTQHKKRCINFAGKTRNIRELIDLYNISDLLITNDSGPAHFASVTSIPIIVFFGPESPILYRPLGQKVKVMYSHFMCSPCINAFNHRKTSCKDNKCLQAISVEEVCQAAISLLKG
jgi:ADP-heptose:LPS heptosyltransferase